MLTSSSLPDLTGNDVWTGLMYDNGWKWSDHGISLDWNPWNEVGGRNEPVGTTGHCGKIRTDGLLYAAECAGGGNHKAKLLCHVNPCEP